MFTDKAGRPIEIRIGSDDVAAYHAGKQIGYLGFHVIEDDHTVEYIAQTIDVEQVYQRAGIGSEMLRAARAEFGDFRIPGRTAAPHSEYYYSQEGAQLIQACVRSGILSREQYMDADEWSLGDA